MSTDKATRLATIANHCQLPGQIFMSQWGPPRTPGPLLKTQAIITPSLWSHTHFLSVGWTKHRPLSRPSVPQSCSICQKFCARVRRERWRQNHCRAERGKKKKKEEREKPAALYHPRPSKLQRSTEVSEKEEEERRSSVIPWSKAALAIFGKKFVDLPFLVCVWEREREYSAVESRPIVLGRLHPVFNPQTISTVHSAPVWWDGTEACRHSSFLTQASCFPVFSSFPRYLKNLWSR